MTGPRILVTISRTWTQAGLLRRVLRDIHAGDRNATRAWSSPTPSCAWRSYVADRPALPGARPWLREQVSPLSDTHTRRPTMPERIQRRRSRGWRTPEGAVYVGRPTRWGNPWCPCKRDDCGHIHAHSVKQAVAFFEEAVMLRDRAVRDGRKSNGTVPTTDEIRAELAGKDLTCWCPPGQPCHADVLLRLANEEEA